MSDVHVKVVAAMKQPMEADVNGGTAEAVFERPCQPVTFCWRLVMMMGGVPIL